MNLESYQYINTIEQATDKLLEQCNDVPLDGDRVKKALDFTLSAHQGQMRKRGEPYSVHPILVASLVASITKEEDMIIAGLLHDVVEDTDFTSDYIHERFGEVVASMVDSLTKIDDIKKHLELDTIAKKPIDQQNIQEIKSALNLRKVLFESIHNEKVFIIKLCDRLHNLMTLEAMRPDKQKRIANESIIIYSPVAHRLGISLLKNGIEDISFKYLYPDKYGEIKGYLNEYKASSHYQEFAEKIKSKLYEEGFSDKDFEIKSRIKHAYSCYMKMQRKGIDISEILDIFAIRVIVKKKLDCYKVLGVIHTQFRPVIYKLKDFIALPKENGYQTLHTTVLEGAYAYEIQIRTQDMHYASEYGVAAHWRYKGLDSTVPNLNWFKKLEHKNSNLRDFQDLVMHDLYIETVEVYSPTNTVFSLPRGSVVLDFAYAIHSDLGDYAVSAMVNDKRASLLQELKSGDIIRIEKGETLTYHYSWLDVVKTAKAKRHIRHNCRHRLKEINTKNTYNMLCTFFDKKIDVIKKAIDKTQKQLGTPLDMDKGSCDVDAFKHIILEMHNHITSKNFFKMFQAYKLKYIAQNAFIIHSRRSIKNTIIGHCCHPKVGDSIIGFLGRSKEVIVHHKMCSEAFDLLESNTPTVFIEWNKNQFNKYRLVLKLEDRKGILANLLKLLSALEVNIISIALEERDNQQEEFCEILLNTKNSLDTIKGKLLNRGYLIQRFDLMEYIDKEMAYQ